MQKVTMYAGIALAITLAPISRMNTITQTLENGPDGWVIRYDSPSGRSSVAAYDEHEQPTDAMMAFRSDLFDREGLERGRRLLKDLLDPTFDDGLEEGSEVEMISLDPASIDALIEEINGYGGEDENENEDAPYLHLGHDGGVWTF